jgi:hypothetical protein
MGEMTQYDTGRVAFCWFNGPPGEGLRAVRRAAEEMVLGAMTSNAPTQQNDAARSSC